MTRRQPAKSMLYDFAGCCLVEMNYSLMMIPDVASRVRISPFPVRL